MPPFKCRVLGALTSAFGQVTTSNTQDTEQFQRPRHFLMALRSRPSSDPRLHTVVSATHQPRRKPVTEGERPGGSAGEESGASLNKGKLHALGCGGLVEERSKGTDALLLPAWVPVQGERAWEKKRERERSWEGE